VVLFEEWVNYIRVEVLQDIGFENSTFAIWTYLAAVAWLSALVARCDGVAGFLGALRSWAPGTGDQPKAIIHCRSIVDVVEHQREVLGLDRWLSEEELHGLNRWHEEPEAV
jgi:hypothetical protein